MKILVTGGAGFIGSHLVDALLERGDDVHVVDNLFSGVLANLPRDIPFHQLDINDPRTADLIRNERFEVIFHHAAQMDVRRSVLDPAFDAQTNILGTIRLLESAVQAGTHKFIFASSGGTVYGDQEVFPAPESHRICPLSPYGIAKATGESYLHYYYKIYDLPYISLRYANVYGPRQNPRGEAGVVAIFIDRMLKGEKATVNGDGLQTRDYVYVNDVVNANILALEQEHYVGPLNVGTGRETTVVEICEALQKALSDYTFHYDHGPAKAGEQRRSVLDISRIRKNYNWFPEHNLQDGIAKTAAWFMAQQG